MSTPEKPEVYAKEWEEWCQKPEGELRKFMATGTPYQKDLASEVLRHLSAQKDRRIAQEATDAAKKAANAAVLAVIVSFIA